MAHLAFKKNPPAPQTAFSSKRRATAHEHKPKSAHVPLSRRVTAGSNEPASGRISIGIPYVVDFPPVSTIFPRYYFNRKDYTPLKHLYIINAAHLRLQQEYAFDWLTQDHGEPRLRKDDASQPAADVFSPQSLDRLTWLCSEIDLVLNPGDNVEVNGTAHRQLQELTARLSLLLEHMALCRKKVEDTRFYIFLAAEVYSMLDHEDAALDALLKDDVLRQLVWQPKVLDYISHFSKLRSHGSYSIDPPSVYVKKAMIPAWYLDRPYYKFDALRSLRDDIRGLTMVPEFLSPNSDGIPGDVVTSAQTKRFIVDHATPLFINNEEIDTESVYMFLWRLLVFQTEGTLNSEAETSQERNKADEPGSSPPIRTASSLSQAFGALPLRGFFPTDAAIKFGVSASSEIPPVNPVYQLPRESDHCPQTLGDAFQSSIRPSIPCRLAISIQVVMNMACLLLVDWTHRELSPENILTPRTFLETKDMRIYFRGLSPVKHVLNTEGLCFISVSSDLDRLAILLVETFLWHGLEYGDSTDLRLDDQTLVDQEKTEYNAYNWVMHAAFLLQSFSRRTLESPATTAQTSINLRLILSDLNRAFMSEPYVHNNTYTLRCQTPDLTGDYTTHQSWNQRWKITPVQPDDGAAAERRQENAKRHRSTGGPTETQLQDPKKQKSAPSPRDQPKLSSDLNSLPTSAMEPRNTKTGFGRRRIYPVQPDPVILKIWHSELLPNIERSLSALPPKYKPRSLSVNLLGIGESQESAKPTIVITCDGPNSQIIKKYLLQKFPVHETLGFDLKVRKGATTRCSLKLRRRWALRSRGAEALKRQEDPSVKINRSIQSKPSPGASICAYRDGWELPPGTFGGVIEIDGDCFGMTVHHLLDLLSLGLESEGESNEPTSAMDGLREEEPEALSLPEETADDEEDPMLWESDVDDSDEDIEIPWETSFDGEDTDNRIATSGGALTPGSPDDLSLPVLEPGDVPGLNPDHTENILIMQPAFHDLENLPDHDLSSQVFGRLLASSGLRRLHHSGTSHEIDWALFEVNEDRLSPANRIRGAGKFCSGVAACNDRRDVVLQRILRLDELASKSVHASGRTTGLQRGVISPAMGLVMLPGRKTSSMSWHVVGNLGVEGDSGSWVVDEAAGVAGVVLARVEGLNQTYIAPMEMLVGDIKRTLGVDQVGLPGQTGMGVQEARMLPETVAPIEVFMGAGEMEGLTAVEMEVRSPV